VNGLGFCLGGTLTQILTKLLKIDPTVLNEEYVGSRVRTASNLVEMVIKWVLEGFKKNRNEGI
jgi:hypothetical protein